MVKGDPQGLSCSTNTAHASDTPELAETQTAEHKGGSLPPGFSAAMVVKVFRNRARGYIIIVEGEGDEHRVPSKFVPNMEDLKEGDLVEVAPRILVGGDGIIKKVFSVLEVLDPDGLDHTALPWLKAKVVAHSAGGPGTLRLGGRKKLVPFDRAAEEPTQLMGAYTVLQLTLSLS